MKIARALPLLLVFAVCRKAVAPVGTSNGSSRKALNSIILDAASNGSPTFTSSGKTNGHAVTRRATIRSLRAGTRVAQSSSDEGEVLLKSAADFVEKDSDATKGKISDTANDDSSSSASPPSVCVIGCGPGGMFFLHALATRKEKLRRAGNVAALRALPVVDVYEKKSSPGGVWRSATAEDDVESEGDSAQMYEALWINANKEPIEFFDYTFDEHFKKPMPVYLQRRDIFEYMLKRVTRKEDIFQYVHFNTNVQSVSYNEMTKKFDLTTRDLKKDTTYTKHYDKCIWAAGNNGRPRMPTDLMKNLKDGKFSGNAMHSSEIGRFQDMRGKRIVLVGDSYSAADIALYALKRGADRIFIASRGNQGTASTVSQWPRDGVEIIWYALPRAVTPDGKGLHFSNTSWSYEKYKYEFADNSTVLTLNDISAVIFCTGYHPMDDMLSDELRKPWDLSTSPQSWSPLEGWKMKQPNSLSELGDVELSKSVTAPWSFLNGIYRRVLINNPSMMYLQEHTSYPLLELDVAAWLCLSYICGDIELPSSNDMKRQNSQQFLSEMNVPYIRYSRDPNYSSALSSLPDDHWYMNGNYSSKKYHEHVNEYNRFEVSLLARDMDSSGYPGILGTEKELSSKADEFLRMALANWIFGMTFKTVDGGSALLTPRDVGVDNFRSLYTGTPAVPLPGLWMEVPDGAESPSFIAPVPAPVYNPLLQNVSWENFTVEDFEQALGCPAVFSKPRPIHNDSTWHLLRQIYEDIVGPKNSTIMTPLADPRKFSDGYAIPYHVDYSPGKGRGIFASSDIKKGDLVWSTKYTATFLEGNLYRRYLASLPSDLACDVMMWAYLDDDPRDEDEALIRVDLDPGSFCNDGGLNESNVEWKNYKMLSYHSDFAARDIMAGEEILCHYESFENEDDWEVDFVL